MKKNIIKEETIEEAIEIIREEYPVWLDETAFKLGAKWMQERSYSDMQEYATFCIECDRKEMPLLLVKDWYEQFKNK